MEISEGRMTMYFLNYLENSDAACRRLRRPMHIFKTAPARCMTNLRKSESPLEYVQKIFQSQVKTVKPAYSADTWTYGLPIFVRITKYVMPTDACSSKPYS